MSDQTLATAIQLVTELDPDEQQTLYNFLADTLTLSAGARRPIQIAGTLGTSLDLTDGDPIDAALADLRVERNTYFDEEWA